MNPLGVEDRVAFWFCKKDQENVHDCFPYPGQNFWIRYRVSNRINNTRMHSSRMRTVRNSSRLLMGVPSPGGVCSQGVVVVVSQHALRQTPLPPLDRQTGVKTASWLENKSAE